MLGDSDCRNFLGVFAGENSECTDNAIYAGLSTTFLLPSWEKVPRSGG